MVHVLSGIVQRDMEYREDGDLSKEDMIKSIMEKRILMALSASQLPQNIDIQILQGEIISSLKKHIDAKMYDAVVMGTRDNYDIIDRWFGTISLGVVKTVRIPVYLIPRHSHYKLFKKVMIASDYHLLNKELISRIISWNNNYEAFIEFLHIQANRKDQYDQEKEKILNALIEKDYLNFAFQMKTIQSKEVASSILASAYNEKSDLLVLIAENRSFINTLLFKSLSREMILKSNIPILFMH